MSVALILGSAFERPELAGHALTPVEVDTAYGAAILYRWPNRPDGWVLFRHGTPHRWLPNQIPYRAQAAALGAVGVEAVLITSSVGVIDLSVPLFTPLRVTDLVMPDNRLPDGSACTLFVEPWPGQGHLVVDGGLYDAELGAQIEGLAREVGHPIGGEVEFTYVGGPRTKSPAENRWFARMGTQVNSMTVGPETVLLNELGIAVAAVVVGHKHSHPDAPPPPDDDDDYLAASLDKSREATEALAAAWLDRGVAVPFKNHFYRFEAEQDDDGFDFEGAEAGEIGEADDDGWDDWEGDA